MAFYLNTNKPLENYKALYKEMYFVDKSEIIERLNNRLGTASKYICITRPRRFGKTSVADMLGAYYSKGLTANEIFEQLEISKAPSYKKHLNQYQVINISFNERCEKGSGYEAYIEMIRETIKQDIAENYPDLEVNSYFNISRLLRATNDQFIFILDEWDYIFSHSLFKAHQDDFLEFLRDLLKDQPYVLLAYMTGVLPIKKYSSGSALNMFDEFTFLKDRQFGEYFGFTQEEVIKLCQKNGKMSLKELEQWYNGYVSAIVKASRKMLKATVSGDTKTVEEILHKIHNSEIPILQYNDENSLSCVLTLAYLDFSSSYLL